MDGGAVGSSTRRGDGHKLDKAITRVGPGVGTQEQGKRERKGGREEREEERRKGAGLFVSKGSSADSLRSSASSTPVVPAPGSAVSRIDDWVAESEELLGQKTIPRWIGNQLSLFSCP